MHWIRREVKRQVVWVDKADEYLLSHYTWQVDKKGYLAAVDSRAKTVKLHKLILQVRPGMQVDHINGNRRDNRRCNLREVTSAQNCQNRRAANQTGLKGVHPRGKKFFACIRVEGKFTYLGIYPTAEEAARVYDEAAHRAFGEFARLNFPAVAA